MNTTSLPARSMFAASLLAILTVCGCSRTAPIAGADAGGAGQNDGLNSTLWALVSAEYDATAEGIFHSAMTAVEDGLSDTAWTALPDQQQRGNYGALKPAVILDVDETVLDNGVYQAKLVTEGNSFSSDSWLEWVLEERATPIPGALAYTRRVAAMGVTVIYLTNRRGHMEEATRRNLTDLGFPIDTSFDVVLTRGERPEWSSSDKSSRRALVAENFRVLAMVGDNLGDFLDIDGLNLAERAYSVAQYEALWGAKWFMLPNPQYGSWESAAFDGRYDLPEVDRRERKMDRLREIQTR